VVVRASRDCKGGEAAVDAVLAGHEGLVGAHLGELAIVDDTTRSACFTVARRCAITSTVRFFISSPRACWTRNSLSASRSEVASSRRRMADP